MKKQANKKAREWFAARCFRALCSLAFLFACSFVSSQAIAAADKALIAKAEKYLNGIAGLSGGFVQESSGKRDRGTFSMLRPGRVRLDYKTIPVQLVSNGKDLYFYDRSLDQITTVPLTSTPAGILVRKNINLSTADIVVSEAGISGDSFSLKMHVMDQEGMGSMAMTFSADPVALKSWVVTDATGAKTTVVFDGLRARAEYPENYFELKRHKTTGNAGGDPFYE
jgi:outer membrane lipoprotein-sorting protein